MKNLCKSILFIMVFIIIYVFFSYLFLPKVNLSEFGIYKTSSYDILGEQPNSVDVVAVGDSLVYSSICPREIYRDYGYMVFDCAQPAQILPDAYEYYKVAVESQKPKVAIIESNILFRDASKRPWYNGPLKVLKNSMPLVQNHSNWKKLLFSEEGLTNIEKGYKKSENIKPSENRTYMKMCNKAKGIPEKNIEYLKKIIELSKENDIRLVFVGLPSQKTWNYAKHRKMEELAKEFGLEYINLNLKDDLDIDWTQDTKDRGDHLNFYGAKKVSRFLGEYLRDMKVLKDHRDDPEYAEFNKLYCAKK